MQTPQCLQSSANFGFTGLTWKNSGSVNTLHVVGECAAANAGSISAGVC